MQVPLSSVVFLKLCECSKSPRLMTSTQRSAIVAPLRFWRRVQMSTYWLTYFVTLEHNTQETLTKYQKFIAIVIFYFKWSGWCRLGSATNVGAVPTSSSVAQRVTRIAGRVRSMVASRAKSAATPSRQFSTVKGQNRAQQLLAGAGLNIVKPGVRTPPVMFSLSGRPTLVGKALSFTHGLWSTQPWESCQFSSTNCTQLRAKSSITQPWIIRFRLNFVQSLNTGHPKCYKSSRSRGQRWRSRHDITYRYQKTL